MRLKQLIFTLAALPALLFSLSACTTARVYLPEDPAMGWYPSRVENALAGRDPLEGFNRSMFAANDFIMEYVADPVGRVYCTILPRPAIDAIERLCTHVEYPGRLITTLGSAEWEGAWDETCRFFVNTVIGLGGLFDPAEHWLDIHSTYSDFGQMFAVWGIGPGCTLILPLCRSTNVRDMAGALFDTALDIKTYLPYNYLPTLNRFIVSQNRYAPVVAGSSDRYKTFRFLLALNRELQVNRWLYHKKNCLTVELKKVRNRGKDVLPVVFGKVPEKPLWVTGVWNAQPEYFPRTPEQDTLRSVFTSPRKTDDFWYLPLSLFNSDFIGKMSVRKINLNPAFNKAEYAFFHQKPADEGAEAKTEKLAILMPGFTSLYDSKSTLAMAELYYNHGYSVIALDNVFSWRSLTGAGEGRLPGYVPEDMMHLRVFLGKIMADLKKEGLIHAPEKIVMTGWSFGALGAGHIAAQESAAGNPIGIGRYVLINPPVELGYSMKVLEDFQKTSAGWSEAEMRKRLPDTVGELMVSTGMRLPEICPDGDRKKTEFTTAFALPRVDVDAAKCIIAMSLTGGVRDVLYHRHKLRPFSSLRNTADLACRNSLYDELDRITFQRYAKEFLIRELNTKGLDYETLLSKAGMTELESFFKSARHVRVLQNFDDFLLNDSHRKWLDSVFGKRLDWFDAGGHLGNLYLERVRRKILEASGEKLP